MAACVENMFFVGREVPWHGQGRSVESAPTSKDAIRYGGLDWKVVQHDVIDKETGIVIPGFKLNVRDIDNKPLGMVTNRYKICQNEEAFDFTDALLGEGVTYETAGSLSSGKRVWLLARMEGRMMTDEKFVPYLVFTNSHDGTGAIKVALTNVRVVCQNTLNMALAGAERTWSCAHKGDIQGKLEEARMTLSNANNYLVKMEEEFGELKLQKLTDDKVKEFIDTLIPIDENSDAKRKILNLQIMRNELMYRYQEAPDLIPIEKSGYRFINAVSDFVTHTKPLRQTKTYRENLFMNVIDGHAFMDKAYALVKAA